MLALVLDVMHPELALKGSSGLVFFAFSHFVFLFSVLSSSLSEMLCVRSELLAYFTHILLGDALAAEYLILHLISDVYVTFTLITTSELQKDE